MPHATLANDGPAGQPDANAKGKFVTKRAAPAIKEIDDFEGTRDAAAAIRNKVIDNLDLWLERFETRRRGARRHGALGRGRRRGLQAW
jgi:L-lactate utilization protein LutB